MKKMKKIQKAQKAQKAQEAQETQETQEIQEIQKIQKVQRTQKKRLLLLLLGLLLIFIGVFYFIYDSFYRPSFGVISEDILVRIPVEDLPKDTLYITEGRRYYQRGAMTLILPAIDVYTAVGESTTPEGLKEMPGLYEFAQLPGEGDVNVSIAGHRDIHDMVFYSLDKVGDGDYCYLIYNNMIYRYIYKDTKIVKPDNWDVIKPQGFSCLTLTTCDPIGTALNRMIVRAELVDYQSFDEGYRFVANKDREVMK